MWGSSVLRLAPLLYSAGSLQLLQHKAVPQNCFSGIQDKLLKPNRILFCRESRDYFPEKQSLNSLGFIVTKPLKLRDSVLWAHVCPCAGYRHAPVLPR